MEHVRLPGMRARRPASYPTFISWADYRLHADIIQLESHRALSPLKHQEHMVNYSIDERWWEFICEALAADAAVEKGAPFYRAEDVHDWLELLAKDRRATRPGP